MANKIYKLILLGKIAEGYDVEIAHEKLAIVFEIDLKKIPKLLKKPTVIRKNLNETDASRYKHGLEKIGVACQIEDENGIATGSVSQPEPSQAEDETKVEEMFTLVDSSNNALVLNNDTLNVIDVKIPFGAMVSLVLKFTLASIPALIIFWAIVYILQILAGSFMP